MSLRLGLFLALATVAVLSASAADRLKFSPAKKVRVVDTYYGIKVADDYQWLEKDDDPRVLQFAVEQDKRARRFLKRLSERATIKARLEAWSDRASPSYLQLIERPAGLFALIASPEKQQRYIVRIASIDESGSVATALDPNVIDPSGATAIDWWVPSHSGTTIAVSLSEHGSELGTLWFFDSTTGQPLPDRIPRVQIPTGGGSVAWTPDDDAVFYTRYPAPGEKPEADRQFFQQIYFHKLGTDPAKDTYSLGRDFPRIAEIELDSTDDGAFALAQVANGDGGDFAFFLRPDGGAWQQIAHFEDGIKQAILGDDGMIYLLSLHGAPRGRILRMPLAQPDLGSATEVVSQTDGVIRSFAVHDGRLYVNELVGGPSRLQQFSTEGSSTRAVLLPPVCGILSLVPRKDGSLLVRVSRYVEPPAWYLFNPTRSTLRKTALADGAAVDFADVRIERLVARAGDGTEIPITVLSPKSVAADKPTPLLLQAYGSYGATNEPRFQTSRRLWFDAGGVLAIAHVRGGGDFGEAWHKAANLEKKQTTFSDFIACAEALIAQGRTRPEQLAIQGGSAGGLLMGAVLTQRPELFRAVVAHVGIFDSLRVELEPNGLFNTTEFGSVKVRAQFDALHQYSPYHHVVDGTAYPAVLLTAGIHDGRVLPRHSFKMAARLQMATDSKHPILLRVNFGAGHGIGTSRSTRLEEDADVYAFLFAQLDMTVPR